MRRAKITSSSAGYADKKMNATNSEINTQKGGRGEREKGGKHSIAIKQGIQAQGEVSRGISCQIMKHEQEPYRTHQYFRKESNKNGSKKAKQKIKSHP